jgi:hypothetical protein
LILDNLQEVFALWPAAGGGGPAAIAELAARV